MAMRVLAEHSSHIVYCRPARGSRRRAEEVGSIEPFENTIRSSVRSPVDVPRE